MPIFENGQDEVFDAKDCGGKSNRVTRGLLCPTRHGGIDFPCYYLWRRSFDGEP